MESRAKHFGNVLVSVLLAISVILLKRKMTSTRGDRMKESLSPIVHLKFHPDAFVEIAEKLRKLMAVTMRHFSLILNRPK